MVRACNSHAPAGSDKLRGLIGRKGLEWYLPAVGQVRFLASQEVIGISGRLSCKEDMGIQKASEWGCCLLQALWSALLG